ncbi:hypothetical protein TURU_088863 [Turdus rufiventris]|nr:hypothetical protein TURU_088863 [Turdus rufiventris]
MDGNTFHLTRLLKTPSKLALNSSEAHSSPVSQEQSRGAEPPNPVGHAAFDTVFCFLSCSCTLPALVELIISLNPLLRAALNLFSAQSVLVSAIAPNHLQDLALDVVELDEACTEARLKAAPLDGIPFLWHDCTTQLGVISKLDEGALDPTVHVISKDIKQCQSATDPVEHHSHALPLEIESYTTTPKQNHPNNSSSAEIPSRTLQFRDKDLTWDSVKCFAQVQVDGVTLLLSTKHVIPS